MTFVESKVAGIYSNLVKKYISSKYLFSNAYKIGMLEILAMNENMDNIIQIIWLNVRNRYRGEWMIHTSPVDEV